MGSRVKALEQGFTIMKTAVGFHGGMANTPGFYYGNVHLLKVRRMSDGVDR